MTVEQFKRQARSTPVEESEEERIKRLLTELAQSTDVQTSALIAALRNVQTLAESCSREPFKPGIRSLAERIEEQTKAWADSLTSIKERI